PVKRGLGQPSLASPEVALARHEAIANETMEKRRAERLRFTIALRVRRQQRLDVARVVKKVSVDVKKPRVNNVAVVAATGHEAERVPIEVAHNAHDQGALRTGRERATSCRLFLSGN